MTKEELREFARLNNDKDMDTYEKGFQLFNVLGWENAGAPDAAGLFYALGKKHGREEKEDD